MIPNSIFNNVFRNSAFQLFRRCIGIKPSYLHNVIPKNEPGKNGEKYGIQLLKNRGQHLLVNSRVIDSIVRTSDINPNDTVLEIGPGTGNLTLKLLQVAKKVVAIEIDKRMVAILRERAAQSGLQDRLNIICGDALKIEFPEFNLVVANIPYGISSPLLAKLVYQANFNPFRSATLLLQKEFAKRLVAKPGDSEFNRLAVNIKLLAEVEIVMDVSKRDFVPSPKVDSSVVKVYPKIKIPNVNFVEWLAFTRMCFGNKNKTIGALFKQKKKLMELMKLSCAEMLLHDGKGENFEYGGEDNGDVVCLIDEDDINLSSSSKTDMSLFKGKILGILEANGFLDKRSSKLSNDELLHLLSLLNQAGINFHDHGKQNGIHDSSFFSCNELL